MLITGSGRSAAVGVTVAVQRPCGPDQSASGQDLAMTLMGHDHLDLLLSAALEYQVPLPASTRASFSPLVPVTVRASAVGAILHAHNAAACGRDVDRSGYTFTAVSGVDPVAVIKAAHAMAQVCSGDPHWAGSAADQFLCDLLQAATIRIHGYTEAAWEWRRPPTRLGPAFGCALSWRPDIPGLTWTTPDHLSPQMWRSARHVLLTLDAAEVLDALEPRDQVIVVAGESAPTASQWHALSALTTGDPVIAWWPIAREWLASQLPELPWTKPAQTDGADT